MAPLTLTIGLAGLIAKVAAQSDTTEIVWSSAAYVFYGSRTPLRASSPSLTPEGAQQLYQQGSMFRARYLDGSSSNSTTHLIHGLESNAIDNSQLYMASSTDPYTSGSALAFMQGLYPPNPSAFANGAGGVTAAQLANGTMTQFPLGGYQYPNVKVISTQDPESVWLEGHVSCTQYQASGLDFRADPTIKQMFNDTQTFYQQLWDGYFSKDRSFSRSMVNFWYAYDLWDYASYQFRHNVTARGLITPSDLVEMGRLASIQQRDINGNLSASGLTDGDMIRAIAGRTLASKILVLLKSNIASTGSMNKMSLMFGSFEPMVAFFALSKLVSGPSASIFQNLPAPGAALVFELYSIGGNASVYPASKDLLVRFMYRNGSDSGSPFTQYSLFGNPNWPMYMTYDDFAKSMTNIGINNVANWCTTCQSVNLFCSGFQQSYTGGSGNSSASNSNSTSSGGVTPLVAGIIGAALTLFIFGLGLAGRQIAIMQDRANRAAMGGFKGPEKKDSDKDVAFAKNGARHERVGSWELRGGGTGINNSAKEVEEGVVSISVPSSTTAGAKKPADFGLRRLDDDNISELGHSPVMPRESF